MESGSLVVMGVGSWGVKDVGEGKSGILDAGVGGWLSWSWSWSWILSLRGWCGHNRLVIRECIFPWRLGGRRVMLAWSGIGECFIR